MSHRTEKHLAAAASSPCFDRLDTYRHACFLSATSRPDIAALFPCVTPVSTPSYVAETSPLEGAEVLAQLIADVAQSDGNASSPALGQLTSCTVTRLDRLLETAIVGGDIADVAHDIRQPVQALRLFAESLVSDVLPSASTLNHIRTVACSTHDLIAALRFDRFVPQPAKLGQACRDAVAELHEYGMSIDIVDEGGDAQVLLDHFYVYRVISNVVANAKESGAKRMRLRVASADAHVTLTVWDDGEPIPADIAAQLFADRVSGKADGHGYGTLNIKKIIDRHGGSIAVIGLSGEKFRITLPRLLTPPSDSPPQRPSPGGGDRDPAHDEE